MNKVEQIFIRACKSADPYTRLQSVYRHFYYADYSNKAVVNILVDICGKHGLLSIGDIVNDLAPYNDWKYSSEENIDYWEKCVHVLCSTIRLSSVDKFSGLTPPLRFRLAA